MRMKCIFFGGRRRDYKVYPAFFFSSFFLYWGSLPCILHLYPGFMGMSWFLVEFLHLLLLTALTQNPTSMEPCSFYGLVPFLHNIWHIKEWPILHYLANVLPWILRSQYFLDFFHTSHPISSNSLNIFHLILDDWLNSN